MRYLSINKIQPGTYLAKTLYDYNGSILLHKNYKMTDHMIRKLKSLGYKGIYIEDKISEGIIIDDVIDERLKISAANIIEDIAENNGEISNIKPIVEDVVDSILNSNDVILSMHSLYDYHEYTYSHCVNVGIIAAYLGIKLKYAKKELILLTTAGMLHDIGKKNIPLSILDKKEKLTDEEYKIVKEHPIDGYNMIKKASGISGLAKVAVLDHHERLDGSGYPRGLDANNISPYSMIVAVADTYDAMTSDRSYRKGHSPSEAIEFLMGDGGILFDFNIVNNFTKCIAVYPDGSSVKLSDGTEAVVVKNYYDAILRPVVRLADCREIDLKYDTSYLNVSVERLLED